MDDIEKRLNERIYYLENEWGKTVMKVVDLEAELSNCRAQGLETEKDLVTVRLELQELRKMFEEHYHTEQGRETSGPNVSGQPVTGVTRTVTTTPE